MTDKIDIAALLAGVDIVQVIDGYVPLTKNGAEHEACCPFHTESTPSFKVNPAKQFYHCFGCGAHGNAINFLMEHLGLSFVDACRELGADIPGESSAGSPVVPRAPVERPKKRKTPWVAFHRPVGEVPGPPSAHVKRGRPSHTWIYRDPAGHVLGFVYRFTTSDGGKETLPIVWARNEENGDIEWRWMAFAEPRPLFLGETLRPDKPVLIVEGEKCVVAAHILIGDVFDVVSWPGGGKAVHKADWSWLAGRNVLIWPDCDAQRDKTSQELLPELDQAGVKAAHAVAKTLVKLDCKVRILKIPAPGEKPSGWDVFDAIADGWTREQTLDFLRTHQQTPTFDVISRVDGSIQAEPPENPTQAGAGNSWAKRLIYKRGELAACLSNVFDILANRPEWKGVVAFDEFSQRTVKLKPPPYLNGTAGEWEAVDDSYTAMWLSRSFGFTPSSLLVAEAVEVLAKSNSFHPVRNYLGQLKWDDTPRLDDWLTDFLGVKKTEYTMRVARFFLIAMVARVMQPGVKFDYCLVFEGKQGIGKSSAARILGGDWFSDAEMDLKNKDSMSAIRGKWVHEFAELGSLTRAEATQQKSYLSRQFDEFRPVYGRREIRCPRQTVFTGSTNEEFEWIRDPTGGRRFWGIACEELINLVGLQEARDQLLAEAFVRYQAGERFFPTAEEQRDFFDREQLRREQQESFVDLLHDWVYERIEDFSLAEAAVMCLKMDASKISPANQTRIGIALKKLGCRRIERSNGMTRFWYKPPQKSAASSAGTPAQQDMGDERVPF